MSLAHFHKVLPDEILVVHDEMDLPPGRREAQARRRLGGHNGLKDISAHLSTPQYYRLRIGVGHPRDLIPGGGKPT